MKNSESIRVNPKNSKKPFTNKTKLGIESNYLRSIGYNTKSRKVKQGYVLFRSKNKVADTMIKGRNKNARKNKK